MPAEPAPADLAACEALLAEGSRSFAAAARLLPRRVRLPAAVLYAFCRVADDEVDAAPGATPATVRELSRRLDRVWAGCPHDDPVDRALAVVARERGLPRGPLDALLEGLTWDAEARRYETLDDLHAYAARVAGSVGVLMTSLMGSRDPLVLARACDLGVAMQLTNVARDVAADARCGRVYLPLAWLRAEAVTVADLLGAEPPRAAIARVVRRLLEAAGELYTRAEDGIARLPADCRVAIFAARLIYADIGRSLARGGFDPFAGRARVSAGRKLWLAARAMRAGSLRPTLCAEPPLEPARFLVEAAAGAP